MPRSWPTWHFRIEAVPGERFDQVREGKNFPAAGLAAVQVVTGPSLISSRRSEAR